MLGGWWAQAGALCEEMVTDLACGETRHRLCVTLGVSTPPPCCGPRTPCLLIDPFGTPLVCVCVCVCVCGYEHVHVCVYVCGECVSVWRMCVCVCVVHVCCACACVCVW